MVETEFAPALRANTEEIEIQQALFLNAAYLSPVPEVVSELVAVLNKERQLIYANRALLDFLKPHAYTQVYGRRIGELFRCIHAEKNAGGCGTSRDCRYCEAVLTVLKTMEEGKALQENCMVYSDGPVEKTAMNFRLQTIPLQVADQKFVMISIKDLNAEKRKAALERIFFHDILNTVSSLKVNIELLKRSEENPDRLLKNVSTITDALVNEIRSQQMLVNAENRTLRVTRDLIDAHSFLEEIISDFQANPLAAEKKLEFAPFSEAFTFISDSAILRRVLVNAVKNALEATPPQSRITLASRQEPAGFCFRVHNPGVIPPEVRAHLFYRYFSTKGENRGLGTYSMKLLTEEYLGGEVHCESREEEGTTFFFRLPRDIKQSLC